MVYTGVEGAEEIPGSISLKEDVSGSQAEGTLFLRKSRIVREEWQDGFTAPVTFHAYGADEYHGGSLVIPGDAVLETCVSMGGQLLEFMGLSPLEYRILSADWYGESYEDEEGRMCARPWSGDKSSLGTMRLNMKGKSAGLNRKPKSWRWFTGRFPRFLLQLWRQLRGQNMYLRRRFRVKARKEVSGTGYAAVLS